MSTPPPTTIWDYWADRYERLWAQHFSLTPSRELVHERLAEVAWETGRLLDVGCGVGQFAAEVADRRPGWQVLGVDPAPAMIERAERDYARPGVSYRTGFLWDVPRGDGFDVITSMHAFPYMPDKYGAMCRLRELLRPGGRLLIIGANTEGLYDRGFLLFVKLTTTRAQYLSAAGLHRLMDRAGLRPGVVRPIDAPRFIPSIQLVEGVLPEGAARP